MSLNPTSPVIGAAVSGFTSPTYTISEDQGPLNWRLWHVTSLGGTQTNVEVDSTGSPFTLLVSRPNVIKTLPRPNPSTGVYSGIPVNEYRVLCKKGVTIIGGSNVSQEAQASIQVSIRLPAGFELAGNDPEEVKAMLSLVAGFLWANADGLYTLGSTAALK